jgi:gluconokinase
MGVSGSGKTTVATLLAEQLGVPLAEADDFHPSANITKMSAGVPLNNEDRAPWLDAIAGWLAAQAERGAVVTCSALKRRSRERLRKDVPELFFLHLDGSPDLIALRLAERAGHFMPPSLLRSQFADLEPLAPGERGAAVSLEGPPDEVARRALALLPH